MSDAIIVAIISGSITLIGAVISVLASNKGISRDIKELKDENKEQSLSILRLTVMNGDMPISERLIAGQKYIRRGGNGDVKHYFEELVKSHTK